MGLVLYLFGAVAFVLIVGWAIYVAPTPGELAPWQLTVALVPVLTIVLGVAALLLTLWLAMKLVRFALRSRRKG
jgi:hypothetical protein